MRPRQGTHAATLALLAFAAAAAAREAPYHLVDNFSRPLPSSDRLACQPESEGAKVGLAACRVSYRLDRGRRAVLALPDPTAEAGAAAARRLPGAGALKLWVKGDGSGAELRLVVRHVTPFSDAEGRRRYRDHRDLLLRSGPLDFADWRELTFDASALPPDKLAWWSRLELHGSRRKDAPTSGTILLDDLRLYPDKRRPSATAAAGLIGPSPRPFGSRVALFLDVRSFTRTPATVRARVTMTDRNDNRIVDRDVGLRLPPFGSKEQALELEPKNLGAFLPPFTVACDVLSADLPDASMKVDSKLVMANCVALFDDFSDLFGHWFTAGFRATTSRGRQVWSNWTMGEAQRTNPWPQTSARIARVALGPDDAERGRFAMRLDFQGEAMVYRSLDRHLPGNPYRLALWVKGDGSGATLSALTLDYTDNADFWEGGWRRTRHGERTLCVLDFTGWRRVEAPLPGNGLGSNTPRGSTDAIDYPLELTGFRVRPAKDKPQGSVLLAAVAVHTQAPQAATLALHLAYDDPNHRYAPDRGAWLTVHNGWPGGDRRVRATWALLDRQGDEVAKGRAELHVPSGRSRAHRIGFPRDAAARQGPLRLRATAFAVDDASVSASRDIILAKPDSRAFVTGFEADRGYLGLKALGVESPPPAGQPAAHTSTDRAHGGKRSLALAWDKATRPTLYVAVDPPLPGVPVELSAWVFGDGSGALVYPVIGDSEGISHGAHDRQWDLFLARRDGAELQNVVRVDWKGWRELTFRLPPIPPSWREPLPVLGFEPSYPLGLHVAVDATDAASPRGTLYLDDVSVLTHLEPRERLTLALERPHEWNVVAPGGALRAVVANHDAAAPRKGTVSGGALDWRGRRVAGSDVELQLGPGERRRLVVARDLPRGSYAVRLRLTQGQQTLATLVDDLLVQGGAEFRIDRDSHRRAPQSVLVCR